MSDEQHDAQDAAEGTVRDINSGPVSFDVDSRKERTLPPYRLKMNDQIWTVEQPDVGAVMQAENAPTFEVFMQVMFDEQWDDLGPIFKAYKDPSLMFDVASAIAVHFNLDAAAVRQAPRNRRERRAEPRR